MELFGPAGRGDLIARRVALPLFVLLAIIVVPVWIIHTPIQVDGDSMFPTLHHSDRVLITRGHASPRVGDVVAIMVSRRPGLPPELQLKRVMAVEGQRVAIDRGRALVDGAYETLRSSTLLSDGDFSAPEQMVPADHIYVLGDNRPVSRDSRFYGPVPLEVVRGRVTFVIAPINRFGRVD